MSDETHYRKLIHWVENNRVFSIFLVMAFVLTPLSIVFDKGQLIYARFINKPFDEKVLALIDKGCILFLPDSSIPVSDKENIVNAYKAYWREIDVYYATKIFISGHVHSRGSNEYNLSYGERRAQAASDFLEANAQITPELVQIQIISFGEERGLEREGEYECGARVSLIPPV